VSTDTSAPFTVCSSSDCSVYFPAGSSSCGTAYLLQAVPYSSSGGSLVAGTPFSLSFTMAPGGGLTMAQDSGGDNVTITPPANDNRILIDDGPAFSKPIVDQSFSTSSLAISNILSSGLVQGITYHLKSLPSGATATCVIQPAKWNLILPQSDWLTQA